jgi:hypothetical protein
MKLLRNLPVHKPKGRKGRSRLVSKKKKIRNIFFSKKKLLKEVSKLSLQSLPIQIHRFLKKRNKLIFFFKKKKNY